MHTKKCKRYNEPGHAHELTFSCYKQRPFLEDEWVCRLLADAVTMAKDKHSFHVWSYVFMPEHVHLLVWPTLETYSISGFLQSLKQSVSRKVIGRARAKNPEKLCLFETGQVKEPYQFWLPGGGYDRNVIKRETLAYTVNYIHRNPVRRGLVKNPDEWKWSSYKEWETRGAGPLHIDRGSFPVLSK